MQKKLITIHRRLSTEKALCIVHQLNSFPLICLVSKKSLGNEGYFFKQSN